MEADQKNYFPKFEHLGDATPYVERIYKIVEHFRLFELSLWPWLQICCACGSNMLAKLFHPPAKSNPLNGNQSPKH